MRLSWPTLALLSLASTSTFALDAGQRVSTPKDPSPNLNRPIVKQLTVPDGPASLILGSKTLSDFLPSVDSDGNMTVLPGRKIGRYQGDKFISEPDALDLPLAAPGMVKRSLAQKLFERASVLDYGALCDGTADDTVGVSRGIAGLVAGEIRALYVPAGSRCRVSTALRATLPAAGVAIEGAGLASSEIAFTGATDGFDLTVPDGGGLNFSGLSIVRANTASRVGGKGLSIRGATLNNRVSVREVQLRDAGPRTRAWATGLTLTNTGAATAQDVRVSMPDYTGAADDPVGVFIAGTSASLFSADTKLTAISTQGGLDGVRIGDWVQGVFLNNAALIGNGVGLRWDAPGTYGELLTMTNSHVNSAVKGVYMRGIGQSNLSNILALRFSPGNTVWTAFDFLDSHNLTITGNQVYGAIQGTETGISIVAADGSGSQPNTVTGNSLAALNGVGVFLGGTIEGTTVVGNAMNGVLGGDVNSPVGKNLILGNTFNNVADLSNDGTGNLAVKRQLITRSILPDTGNYLLGGGNNVWGEVWAKRIILKNGDIASSLNVDNSGNILVLTAPKFIANVLSAGVAHQLRAYTVATLPPCNGSAIDYYVVATDLQSRTYAGSVTGGGSLRSPVYCDGTAWTVH